MSIKRSFKKIVFPPILIFCCLIFSAKTLTAKVMEPESLLFQIIESDRNIFQMYIETTVRVFAFEASDSLDDKVENGPPPRELRGKSFIQNIVWIRDEYYLTEILDMEGNALNVTAGEIGGRRYSSSLSKEALFFPEDIEFPYLKFYTKFLSFLKPNLHNWGLPATRSQIVDRRPGIVYRLGSERENLIIDPDNFKVLEINRQIHFEGKFLPMKITFSEWFDKSRKIPMMTRFFINSRLFKEIKVTAIRFGGIYKARKAFMKKYRRFIAPVSGLRLNVTYSR